MKLYKIDNRELRSFRLRHKVLNLRNFFDNKKSFGLFMMNDPLQPNTWIDKRKDYAQNNFKIMTVSKKVSNYLAVQSDWKIIKNLLKGSVVLIKPKTSDILTPKQMDFLLTHEKYALRFGYWNQTMFRANDIKKILPQKDLNNNNLIPLLSLLKQLVIKRSLIIPTLLLKQK